MLRSSWCLLEYFWWMFRAQAQIENSLVVRRAPESQAVGRRHGPLSGAIGKRDGRVHRGVQWSRGLRSC